MRRRHLLGALAALPLAAPAVARAANTATLRFVPQSNLPTLDPMFSAEVQANYGYYVFDTLYSVDGNAVSQPQMAEGHSVSDDQLTWTIRLREGLLFHDGTPVRGIDCAASLERWSKIDNFGKLLGGVVDKWGAADDRTITIHLTRPFPLLLDAIGRGEAQVAFMMPERLARTDPFKPITESIGSGPYRFLKDEYVSGSRVAFARFDRYVPRAEPPDWGSGGKVAHFPRVEWHVIADNATASAALRAGEVDWWEVPLPDVYATLKADPNIVMQPDNPTGRVSYMRMNFLHPPFDNAGVRRAVLMGANQADFMEATFGDDDPSLWRICRSQYPCGSPYAVDAADPVGHGDMKVARQLLKDAGYQGQKAVIISPSDNPIISPLGDMTANLLQQIGMNVELQTSDWGTVVQRRSSRAAVEQGGWSIFHSYMTVSGRATPALNPMVRGDGLHGWFGWWNNPQVETLMQQWLAAPTLDTRLAAGRGMASIANDQVAIVPLGKWFGRTAFRRSITGVRPGGAPYPWNVRPA